MLLVKLGFILIIADGVGSILLPSKWQKYLFWLEIGRIVRIFIGIALLIYFS